MLRERRGRTRYRNIRGATEIYLDRRYDARARWVAEFRAMKTTEPPCPEWTRPDQNESLEPLRHNRRATWIHRKFSVEDRPHPPFFFLFLRMVVMRAHANPELEDSGPGTKEKSRGVIYDSSFHLDGSRIRPRKTAAVRHSFLRERTPNRAKCNFILHRRKSEQARIRAKGNA